MSLSEEPEDFDLQKEIEHDIDIQYQIHSHENPGEKKEDVFQSFTIIMNDTEHVILVYNDQFIHVYSLLRMFFGIELAVDFFVNLFKGDHEESFILFDTHSLHRVMIKVMSYHPEQKAIVNKFIDEKTHLEIDRQCGFIFSKTSLENNIYSHFDEVANDVELLFNINLDGMTADEHLQILEHVKKTIHDETQRCTEYLTASMTFEQFQNKKRQRTE